MRIDIWSDVVCPWCYLGSRRLSAALDQVGRDDVEVHWRAFQLDPGAPREPGDLRQALDRKYGPGSFDAMTPRLVALGRPEGIDYRFDLAQRVNTADAHRLVAWAATQPELESTWPLVEALFRAYFTEGVNLADHTALATVAGSVGLDESLAADALAGSAFDEQVREDQAQAHERGISGVPAFVIDDEWMIPGAQDTERLVQLLGRVGRSGGPR